MIHATEIAGGHESNVNEHHDAEAHHIFDHTISAWLLLTLHVTKTVNINLNAWANEEIIDEIPSSAVEWPSVIELK